MLQNVPGTRDFLPREMIKRQEVMDKIKTVFELYGFSPAETPAFEYVELLEGNIGEEEKLIYRFEDKGGRKLALRYDLTLPLVRMFASNRTPLPFKRYCISRVWRYDEPRVGRYREFWQCDIDTIGSMSMKADAEIISCGIEALLSLDIQNIHEFKLRLNNRKILNEIVRAARVPESKHIEAFRVIDKLDKLDENEIFGEFINRGIKKQTGERLLKMLERGAPYDVLSRIEKTIGKNKGIEELKEIIKLVEITGYEKYVEVDLSLARGLDYYTGPIFEIEVTGKKYSIAGGGRYDNLIEKISGRSIPAVGISLGIERIIDLLPKKNVSTVTEVYVLCVDDEIYDEALRISQKLRREGIKTEVDIMDRNLTNKLKYVNNQGIKKTIIVGQRDLKDGKLTIKDMESGKDEKIPINEIMTRLT